LFTLFYQSKTVSSQFLFLPIYQQEGIWSFEACGLFASEDVYFVRGGNTARLLLAPQYPQYLLSLGP
jgi:hypothetical protein